MKPLLDDLIEKLKMDGVLQSPMIELALKGVDRKDFVLPEYEDLAYENHPLSIGFGQTISQPFTVVFMLELLDLQEDDEVLDVGSGSGWTTALIAFIVSKTGKVTGVERVKELVAFGKANLKKYKLPQAKILYTEKGVGLPEKEFDKILVSASASRFPRKLFAQLKKGGKMVIPINDSIFLVQKDEAGDMTIKEYPGFVFVPLITS